MPRRIVCTVALAAVLASTSRASAQEAPDPVAVAREQYREGVTAFRAHHYGDATVFFERSFALRPHPATLYNAAEARLRAGDPTRAIEQLREVLAMTSPPPDEATVDRARTLAREVGVDPLLPAVHETATSAAECPTCPSCPLPQPCPAVPEPQVVSQRIPAWQWALLGGGALSLVTGFGFYGAALADSGAYRNDSASQQLRMDVRAEGQAFTGAGVAFILVGLAAEGVGIYFVARPAPHAAVQSSRAPDTLRATVAFGPGAVGLVGSF